VASCLCGSLRISFRSQLEIGVQPEDAIGRTIGELFPQRAAWLVALWASAVRSGEPVIEINPETGLDS